MTQVSRVIGWRGILRLVTLIAACLYLSRDIAWRRVGEIMHGAAVVPLAGVVAINGIMMIVKAFRLKSLLRGRASLAACFLAKLTASTINNVAPFRAGDVARVWMLERLAGVTKSVGAVIAVVETLLELVALAALVAVAVLMVPGQRWASWAAPSLLVASAMILFVLGRGTSPLAAKGGVAREGAAAPSRLVRLVMTVQDGAELLRDPKRRRTSVALSLIAWMLEAAMVVLCARAIALPVSFSQAMIVLLGINVAIVLPSLPASAGAFEAGAVFVLLLAGVSKDQAVSFALLYHLTQAIPVTLVGAAVIVRMGPTLAGLKSNAVARVDGARVIARGL
jgi:uncharacterized protein (TIRG00374 family)